MKEKTWQGKKNETRKRDFVKLTFAGLSMTDWFVGVPIKSLFTVMTMSPGCVVSAVGADSSWLSAWEFEQFHIESTSSRMKIAVTGCHLFVVKGKENQRQWPRMRRREWKRRECRCLKRDKNLPKFSLKRQWKTLTLTFMWILSSSSTPGSVEVKCLAFFTISSGCIVFTVTGQLTVLLNTPAKKRREGREEEEKTGRERDWLSETERNTLEDIF